jgi:hypothetical protein
LSKIVCIVRPFLSLDINKSFKAVNRVTNDALVKINVSFDLDKSNRTSFYLHKQDEELQKETKGDSYIFVFQQ